MQSSSRRLRTQLTLSSVFAKQTFTILRILTFLALAELTTYVAQPVVFKAIFQELSLAKLQRKERKWQLRNSLREVAGHVEVGLIKST